MIAILKVQRAGCILHRSTSCSNASFKCPSFRIRFKKWDLGLTVNGFLGGLVAITAPCYWVSPTGAFFIGVGSAFAVVWGLDWLEHWRIDDPIGAVPVHMMAGVWGTISLGLWATGEYGVPTANGADTSTVITGLFYGGGTSQLITQLIGSFSTLAVTLVVALGLMYAVKATGTLRVSKEGELEGLDVHEHGASAYPEFSMIAAHGGASAEPVGSPTFVPGAVANSITPNE
jgi:Amt family ammonium transporter